jgi:hypothetical protein
VWCCCGDEPAVVALYRLFWLDGCLYLDCESQTMTYDRDEDADVQGPGGGAVCFSHFGVVCGKLEVVVGQEGKGVRLGFKKT